MASVPARRWPPEWGGVSSKSVGAPQPRRSAAGIGPPAGARRVAWRAIVHQRADGSIRTAWHLVTCAEPSDPAAHCPEGQRLMQLAEDPDGHCLAGGSCSRCREMPSDT